MIEALAPEAAVPVDGLAAIDDDDDDGLSDGAWFLSWTPGEATACLDGGSREPDLQAIADHRDRVNAPYAEASDPEEPA